MADNTLNTGKIIKILRILDDRTQEELAEFIGCSSDGISSWESGRREPSLKSLKKIAGYFELPLALFIEDEMEIDGRRRILSDKLAEKILRDSAEPPRS